MATLADQFILQKKIIPSPPRPRVGTRTTTARQTSNSKPGPDTSAIAKVNDQRLQPPVSPAPTLHAPSRLSSRQQSPRVAPGPQPHYYRLPVTLGTVLRSLVASVLIAFAWWALSRSSAHSLHAVHTGVEASIQGLRDAGALLAQCCTVPQADTSAISTSFSESIALLDRDARYAADTAVDELGRTLQLIPRKEGTQHGLSCLQTGLIAAQVEYVAEQFVHVTNQHARALNHTKTANDQLAEVIHNITSRRKDLSASRKTKHLSLFEQVKEMVGAGSDTSYDDVLGEYKKLDGTLDILDNTRTSTASCLNRQNTERAVWQSAAEDLAAIGLNLHTNADPVRPSGICLSSRSCTELMRQLDGIAKKVVA